MTHTVAKASTTTTLRSTKNPSAVDEDITFTANVAAAARGATGDVEFFDGTVSLGTAALAVGRAIFAPTSSRKAARRHRAVQGRGELRDEHVGRPHAAPAPPPPAPPSDGSLESGGCGCRTTAPGQTGGGLLTLGIAALGVALVRRRRR